MQRPRLNLCLRMVNVLRKRLFNLLVVMLITLVTIGMVMAVLASPQRQESIVDYQLWQELKLATDGEITFLVYLAGADGPVLETGTDAQMAFEDFLAVLVDAELVSDFRSFYGANTFAVTGSGYAILYLAKQPSVASVTAYREGEAWEAPFKEAASRESATTATGQISGHVTASDGVTPQPGIDVTLYRQSGPVSWQVTGTASTDSVGDYSFGSLVAGIYRVRFRDLSGEYVTEYYDNQFSFSFATGIDVAEGQVVSNIDAVMDIAGRVSGRVTKQGGGNLTGISVTAFRQVQTGWQIFASDTTDNSGRYDIGGLIAGTYRIQFSDVTQQYVTEYYDNWGDLTSADDVLVTAGATTTGIDAVMGPYGSISGNITESQGQYGVEGLDIFVYEYNSGGGYWDITGFGETDINGDYQAYGLVTKNYRLEFADPLGFFMDEFYNNQGAVESATDVAVTLGLDTPGINASLAQPVITQTYPLSNNWNLLSLPLHVPDTETAAAFRSVAGNYEVVWAYDGCDLQDHWKKFDPDAPPFANDLQNVDVEHGMWQQTLGPDTLVITGTQAFKTVFNLCAGWNLISYPSTTARPPAEVLAGIAGKYDIVWGYEAGDGLDPWKKYNPALPVGNDLTMMKPGYGYWLLMNGAATLTVANR